MTGTLTVRENLFFSAALRLPSHMSMRERRERVDKVVGELRLDGCADSKVALPLSYLFLFFRIICPNLKTLTACIVVVFCIAQTHIYSVTGL